MSNNLKSRVTIFGWVMIVWLTAALAFVVVGAFLQPHRWPAVVVMALVYALLAIGFMMALTQIR